MSEQTIPPSVDLRALLAEVGADAYVLAYADPFNDPVSWDGPPPVAGMTGATRSAAAADRVAVQEVCRGQAETLRRWLQLEDAERQVAIIAADGDELREYTPGELAASLVEDPGTDAHVTGWLTSWLLRRNARAPQGVELGWVAASAAWTWHMRALADYPPRSVLSAALADAGVLDDATTELVEDTGMQLAAVLDRMERPYRPRTELVEDWQTLEGLSADVPALTTCANWMLDQIALRDASAQQLRAVLEPDITDHLQDLRHGADHPQEPAPALDTQRTRLMEQARQTVRAYTAAFHAGREGEAVQILGGFPLPRRMLDVTEDARAWRQRSAGARNAVDALDARRQVRVGGDPGEIWADPARLHAEYAYLDEREAHLHEVHDALGRVAAAVTVPPEVPESLHEVVAGLPERRVANAFGSLTRAREVLDGQIAYLQQQPVPAHRHQETAAELALLQSVRSALPEAPAQEVYDGEAIQQRVNQYRAAQSARSAEALLPPGPSPERVGRTPYAPVQTLMPQPGTGGVRP
ncbi:hypothetical protein ACWDA7_38960 [Streptomyces sp. NPDC001156]